MSYTTTSPKVAFFGATGGCTLSALVHTIRAGISCVALVRTPSKLTGLLKAQGLDEDTINAHLAIIQGNAHDTAAIKQTLTAGSGLVDTIVSGLGAAPKLQFKLFAPWQFVTIDDAHVCENAAKALITALQELYTEQPALKSQMPLVSFISTTGISRGPEDVPFWMRFLYHILLAVPHVDKKNMEDTFRNNADGVDGGVKVLRSYIGVRPTLLFGSTDVSDAIGLEKIRAGTETNPAMGYSIKRADVGEWIFRNVVESEERRTAFEGEMVTLTS